MPSFYRVAKRFPPGDDEYLTPRQLGRPQRRGLTDQEQRAFDALSAFDAEVGARQTGRRFPKLGNLIVRYDVPDSGSGITWIRSFGPGHFSLWADKERLKQYQVIDFLASV